MKYIDKHYQIYMAKHELIYSRLNIRNHPPNKQYYITDKQIYYYDNGTKVVVDTEDSAYTELEKNYNFIKPKVQIDNLNGSLKVILDFDIDELSNLLQVPCKIIGRKTLFTAFQKGYNEEQNSYLSKLILHIYSNLLLKTANFETWFKQQELNQLKVSYLPRYIYSIGGFYIDTQEGKILNNVTTNNIVFQGGIIHDSTNLWIDKIITLINTNNNVKQSKKNCFIYTNCTLIICTKPMCTYWHDKLQGETTRIKVIKNNRDYVNVIYNDIMNLDYIIINYEVILHKIFMSSVNEYNLNNNKLETILNIIKNEFNTFDNIKDRNLIIFSLIVWYRIIIDHQSFHNIVENNFDLIMTLESVIKWINISNLPTNYDQYMNMLKFMGHIKDVSCPFYDSNNTICYLEKLFYTLGIAKQIKINEQTTIIQSNTLENTVICNIKNKNISKIYDILNLLCENTVTRQEYIDMMKDQDVMFDNLQCSVCYGKYNYDETLFIRSCHHYFCINCCLQLLFDKTNCPLCRSSFGLNDLIYVDDMRENSKINHLIKLINMLPDDSFVFVHNRRHKNYITNYLQKYKIRKQIQWIYNDISKIQSMLESTKHSNNINIFFYDLYNVTKIKEVLKSCTNVNNVNIYYFVYDVATNKFKSSL